VQQKLKPPANFSTNLSSTLSTGSLAEGKKKLAPSYDCTTVQWKKSADVLGFSMPSFPHCVNAKLR